MTNQDSKAIEYLTQRNPEKFKIEIAHGYLVLFECGHPVFWHRIVK